VGKLRSLEDLHDLMADGPLRFKPEEVVYEEAPEGSAIRCAACLHYFHRAIDGLGMCEVVEEPGDEGILAGWRCQFQTLDDDVFPLMEEES
jgi:hypothetical protein